VPGDASLRKMRYRKPRHELRAPLYNKRLQLPAVPWGELRRKEARRDCLGQAPQPTEVKMRKTALTILGAVLIAGSAAQAASASEHHARKVHRASVYVQDPSNFRGAYNGPSYYIPPGLQAVRARNRQNFGFSGWDPSRPGDFDPSLRPSD
jgi:hypothetical protein